MSNLYFKYCNHDNFVLYCHGYGKAIIVERWADDASREVIHLQR